MEPGVPVRGTDTERIQELIDTYLTAMDKPGWASRLPVLEQIQMLLDAQKPDEALQLASTHLALELL